MKTIVGPTDFTTVSQNSVFYAADLAVATSARLSLIHVCQLPVVISEVPVPETDISTQITEAVTRIRTLRDEVAERTKGRVSIDIEIKVGNVVDEINNYSNTLDVYAVVMGVETTGAIERLLIGGQTFSALNKITWPLIFVPLGSKFSGISKIGLACDLKDVLETVPLREIKNIVNQFHAELHVLNVVTDEADTLHPDMVKESMQLQEMLSGLHPKYHYMGGNNIEKEIMEFAENNHFDFLIVIPKKHSLITRIFQRSHTKKMVLHTQVPLMAIHE